MFFYSSGSSYHIALASIAKYSNAKAQDVLWARVNLDRGALIKIEYQRWFSFRCFIPACWNRYTKLSLSSIPAHLRTRSTYVNNKQYWQISFLVYKLLVWQEQAFIWNLEKIYLAISMLNSQPLVANKFILFTGLYIFDDYFAQKPWSKVIVSLIIMPYANIL